MFSGKAIGRVTATSDVETNEVDVLELAGDAELTFYDGVEQIKANFDNWYDVDVECQGSNVQSVTLKTIVRIIPPVKMKCSVWKNLPLQI